MKSVGLAILAVLMMFVSSAHAEQKKLSFEAKVFLGSLAYLSDEALLDILPPAPDNVGVVAYCQETQEGNKGIIKVNGTAIDMGPVYRDISLPTFCLNLFRTGNVMDANDMRRLAILAWRNVKFAKNPDLQYVYAAAWLGNFVDSNVSKPHDLIFFQYMKFLGYYKSAIDGAEVSSDPSLDKFITEIAAGKVENAIKTLRTTISNEEVNRISRFMNKMKMNTMNQVFDVQGKPLSFVARNDTNINEDFPASFKLLPEGANYAKPAAKRKGN